MKHCLTLQLCVKDILILSVPDEGYSRNVSCTLNLISTFLFQSYMQSYLILRIINLLQIQMSVKKTIQKR